MTNCPVSWKNESFRTPDPMDDWLPLFLFLASYTSQSQVTFLVSFSSLFAAFFSVSPLLSFFSILIHFLHIWAVTECEQKKREKKKREKERTHEPPLTILWRPWSFLLDGKEWVCAHTFRNVEWKRKNEDKDDDWHPMICSMNMNKITPS